MVVSSCVSGSGDEERQKVGAEPVLILYAILATLGGKFDLER
jgi:hypothetical protein